MFTEENMKTGAVRSLGGDRPVTPLDNVRGETERAAVRATEIRRRLASIGERLYGPGPSAGEAQRQVAEALTQGGFIPGTNAAIERLHLELTNIEDALSSFEGTV
jgi:hypothetical protein